jgi:tetratricopeptide (TPR) repeat protein
MKAWPAILLLSLAPALAVADKPQDALKLLDEGIKAFNAGQLPEARDAFSRARELVPDKANPYRWLGLVDARMGRCGDAIKELEIFLQKVPPNDQRVAEAVTLRDRCREDLQPRVGSLVVESTPAGADVRLDDASSDPVGVTPYRSDSVPAGNHVVFVHRAGYESITRGVAVSPRETAQLELALTLSSRGAVMTEAPPRRTEVVARPTTTVHKEKPYWVAGVVVGVLAAAGLAVGLGIGLTQTTITDFPHVGPP